MIRRVKYSKTSNGRFVGLEPTTRYPLPKKEGIWLGKGCETSCFTPHPRANVVVKYTASAETAWAYFVFMKKPSPLFTKVYKVEKVARTVYWRIVTERVRPTNRWDYHWSRMGDTLIKETHKRGFADTVGCGEIFQVGENSKGQMKAFDFGFMKPYNLKRVNLNLIPTREYPVT